MSAAQVTVRNSAQLIGYTAEFACVNPPRRIDAPINAASVRFLTSNLRIVILDVLDRFPSQRVISLILFVAQPLGYQAKYFHLQLVRENFSANLFMLAWLGGDLGRLMRSSAR
jgi:hypothetical protein